MEFDHVDGAQPDLSALLPCSPDGDAQASSGDCRLTGSPQPTSTTGTPHARTYLGCCHRSDLHGSYAGQSRGLSLVSTAASQRRRRRPRRRSQKTLAPQKPRRKHTWTETRIIRELHATGSTGKEHCGSGRDPFRPNDSYRRKQACGATI